MGTPQGWQKNKPIRPFLLFGQSVEDMSQGNKTPLEELSPRQEKLTELSSVGVCVSGRCLLPRCVL